MQCHWQFSWPCCWFFCWRGPRRALLYSAPSLRPYPAPRDYTRDDGFSTFECIGLQGSQHPLPWEERFIGEGFFD
jgi:hypothetical protein